MRNIALTRGLMTVALLALAGCGGSSTAPNSAAPGSTTAIPNPPPPVITAPPVVVAAGKVIPVTMDQTISTKDSNVGDRFGATVSAPVMVDGRTAIPKGARASGHVTVADAAGRVKGGARLVLNLDSVTVGGQALRIHTAAVGETGKGRGKRTAIGAGAGAGVGALIGALAGGGKGAAIGAGAGAGAGTAGAVFTGNRDISIPAETRLSFRLTDSLEVPAQ